MYFDIGQVHSEPPDARPSDELTVVQLNPLQVVARHQVVQRMVSDQWQIVKLKDGQMLRGTRCHTKLPDAFISDQLTVRQAQ